MCPVSFACVCERGVRHVSMTSLVWCGVVWRGVAWCNVVHGSICHIFVDGSVDRLFGVGYLREVGCRGYTAAFERSPPTCYPQRHPRIFPRLLRRLGQPVSLGVQRGDLPLSLGCLRAPLICLSLACSGVGLKGNHLWGGSVRGVGLGAGS